MATTTATIFVGRAHQNDSGIVPHALIRLIEGSRPAFICQMLNQDTAIIKIMPSYWGLLDDIYLIIATYMLKLVHPEKPLYNNNLDAIDELYTDVERTTLYNQAKEAIRMQNIKVVFNILEDSILFQALDKIPEYPCDYEITTPLMKREYSHWAHEHRSFDYRTNANN